MKLPKHDGSLFVDHPVGMHGQCACVDVRGRAGRELTEIETEYVQFSPLKSMTAKLFEGAITERQAVRDAKDKFRSQSASLHLRLY